jgi:hypothetical protein
LYLRKDVDMTGGSNGSRSDEIPSIPQSKPRLEIIHPLELDGAAVQVLRNEKNSSEDTTDSKSESQCNGWQGSYTAQHVTGEFARSLSLSHTHTLRSTLFYKQIGDN